MTQILGIEGTAWAASAAWFDDQNDTIRIETEPYTPETGGIHPREAAEHMRSAIPSVIDAILTDQPDPPDAIAFSRGPGLGPCLRICGTAARTLAGTLDVPLIGVNHMIAHLEIGRYHSGFTAPICLNASGANAHILAYHDGRYRILGETMDTGVGNAIDKLARHFGWSHPGGPKVEEAAKTGTYIDLPYVVKGMDFSFAGITSAAKDAYDAGTPVEDICRGLEETIFAMLTEVAERALSLTDTNQLVLGGGVGQNDRLTTMLASMCETRNASFHVPPDRFLQDNAGMIAVTGAKMLSAGETLPISDSAVRPDYRPDDVPVTWREDESPIADTPATAQIRGAEAVVDISEAEVEKHRLTKDYRHPELDHRLRKERTAIEARLTHDARRLGIPTPVIRDIDPATATIIFEHVGSHDLGTQGTPESIRTIGEYLATLHGAGIVHGDPTTRNIRVNAQPYLIDFGLGFHTRDVEDFAMDLHVLKQSLTGTTDNAEKLTAALEAGYRDAGEADVLARLEEIEARGRYQ